MNIEEKVSFLEEIINKKNYNSVGALSAERILKIINRDRERKNNPSICKDQIESEVERILHHKKFNNKFHEYNLTVNNFVKKFPWRASFEGDNQTIRISEHPLYCINRGGVPVSKISKSAIFIYPGVESLRGDAPNDKVELAANRNIKKIRDCFDISDKEEVYSVVYNRPKYKDGTSLFMYSTKVDPTFCFPLLQESSEDKYRHRIFKQDGSGELYKDSEIIANFKGLVLMGYSSGAICMIHELNHLSTLLPKSIKEEVMSQILVLIFGPFGIPIDKSTVSANIIYIISPLDEMVIGDVLHYDPCLPIDIKKAWHPEKSNSPITTYPIYGEAVLDIIWERMDIKTLENLVYGRFDKIEQCSIPFKIDTNLYILPALVPGALQFSKTGKVLPASETMNGHKFGPYREVLYRNDHIKKLVNNWISSNSGLPLNKLLNSEIKEY